MATSYNRERAIDYTNTNPDYWASVKQHFDKPGATNDVGETGIWIPNLEKEGAERTGLAAVAGGVRAYTGTNYARASGTDPTDNPGAEKAIRLAGTHRGGTQVNTGYAMGSTAPSEHGVHLKGGKVVKDAGANYVQGGGDFGGLLTRGDAITGDWLDNILGPMDSSGMRIRGTYPTVKAPTVPGVGPAGVKTGVGSYYGGGVNPLASMSNVADFTSFVDPNSMFAGQTADPKGGGDFIKTGGLYQTTAPNYEKLAAAAGIPTFSPGLIGAGSGGTIGGIGSPTYGSPPSGFSTTPPAPTTTAASTLIGSPTAQYQIPSTWGGYESSLIPRFHDRSALDKYDTSTAVSGVGPWAYTVGKGWNPAALIGGDLYTPGGGQGGGTWELSTSYPAVKT